MYKSILFLLIISVCCGEAGFSQRRISLRKEAERKPLQPQEVLDTIIPHYKAEIFTAASGQTLPYRVLMPAGFNASKKYPLILFLHGGGERGSNNTQQLSIGGSLFLEPYNRENYPAIVVFPQCAENDSWANMSVIKDATSNKDSFSFPPNAPPTPSLQAVMELTNKLAASLPVSKDQVYVMGLSMGGMGCFEIVRRMPETFAAAVSICGAADSATAKDIRKTAWWIFHGAKDDVVPPFYSQRMVEALNQFYNTEIQYTTYANTRHDSWNMAFKEPGLMLWLFSQRKKP